MSQNEEVNSGVQSKTPEGPCLARVVSHLDTKYLGSLEVQLLRDGAGNNTSGAQVQQVSYMSPFFGTTSEQFIAHENDYNNTQKSYGMWMVPPDVGSLVVVIFIGGSVSKGYWIGCVPDDNMNFMVPGIASTQNTVTSSPSDLAGRTGRAPVAEYNKHENNQNGDPSTFKKPIHPLAQALTSQGLILDDIRGITTSSARRETPSMVFGISTPGPFDKRSGAKQGYIGKSESKVNAFVSHLGGSSFVMDDGDDKFLRKKPAGGTDAGPPEYASVEQGDTDGNVTIPHNELIRIRTRTGHQILFHNSEDLIYIGNARGTTWIELTSNGKIDIYAQDSISVHSENDINFTAKRDINFNAKEGNINLNAHNNLYATAVTGNYEISAKMDGKLTAVTGSTHINSGATHYETATEIHMNGPVAGAAIAAKIPSRVPSFEPWPQHENLNPSMFTPDKTISVSPDPATAGTASTPPVVDNPPLWKNYTTVTDTFNKVTGKK